MSQTDMFAPEDSLPTSLPKSDPTITLRQAQKVLADNLDHGTVCRCCGQYAKRYRRKLTSGLAYALIYINRGDDNHVRREQRTENHTPDNHHRH